MNVQPGIQPVRDATQAQYLDARALRLYLAGMGFDEAQGRAGLIVQS
ncbi:hypothetical protein EDD52_12817 [Primorskyibacter sedentarius]|uniref:Uncharacterized protein n=1 Tax=Primorskyibacter sedentarius TaxID=745311 RepID=A0A4R3IZ93_9RHOB|nr:hypothetical protein EDD52_12817 [Primorskyibacter sedentarius]